VYKFEDGRVKEKPMVYLAGAISAAPDEGRGWRTDITPHLHNHGYQVFNPVIEQPLITGVEREELNRAFKEDLDLYASYCKKIVDCDTDVLLKSALIVCKLDQYSSLGAGTYGELTLARRFDIPVIAWLDFDEGVKKIPSWAFGCITHYSVHEREFYKLIPSASLFMQESSLRKRETIARFFETNEQFLSDT
jgi:hypothetical protein